ncbi:MAG TPA: hypothetical protein VE090_06730 [Methylomirabilota bacterium]|nr:hypothetical protein [Methylomirabilota bacterium]
MNYLIRVLDAERWNFEYREPEHPFKANPLADLRTDSDNLSVFACDKDKNNLDDILLGFASKRYGISKLQYIELEQSELSQLGFEVIDAKEEGNTPVQAANNAHKNIPLNSADKLIALAKHIYSKTENIQTVKSKKIKMLLEGALSDGSLDGNDLNCVLKKIFSIS